MFEGGSGISPGLAGLEGTLCFRMGQQREVSPWEISPCGKKMSIANFEGLCPELWKEFLKENPLLSLAQVVGLGTPLIVGCFLLSIRSCYHNHPVAAVSILCTPPLTYALNKCALSTPRFRYQGKTEK